MSLPSGATNFNMYVTSLTDFDEASLNASGTVSGNTWELNLRATFGYANDQEEMFDYVQAVMEGIKDRLESEFPASSFSTNGDFSGSLPGNPWTA